MFKKFITCILLVIGSFAFAQQGLNSPYSFYGLGSNNFKGTVENRSMGGISNYSDSIHLNLRNPAAYGSLKAVAFTGAISVESVNYKDNNSSDQFNITSVDYFALGLPTKIGGFGAELIPETTVGYKISALGDEQLNEFEGRGGLNSFRLAYGVQPFKNLNIGASLNYRFGNSENKALIILNNVQYSTRDLNINQFSGLSYNFGAMYDIPLKNKVRIRTSFNYVPAATINVDNNRTIAAIRFGNNNSEIVVNELSFGDANFDVELPDLLTLGIGVGKETSWYVGLDYVREGQSNFDALTFNNTENASYVASNKFRLGGFYIPRYDEPNQKRFYKRFVYRAGLRFEETGLNINGQNIEEFGISFGVGIPGGSFFTNANLGLEYGQRGTTSNNLVQENFFSFFLNFTFNDRWFIEKKYN